MVLVTLHLSLDLEKVLLQVVSQLPRLVVNRGSMLIVKTLIIVLLAISNKIGAKDNSLAPFHYIFSILTRVSIVSLIPLAFFLLL